ncbi:hypothetical protein NONO_c73320 [Nocardia nova SH22a]|uniref:Integral membrane protein n=1 Tax=Nocardia nova SH22a TaxID=1415166 RepID=W5TT41_9NOCA|nr:hypothetical protein [Nocardia nova]AHH22088.1 hypothetical protein NONO_c73320 [Nocardia nova SH22a]
MRPNTWTASALATLVAAVAISEWAPGWWAYVVVPLMAVLAGLIGYAVAELE